MPKNTRMLLIVAGFAVAAYFAYRWYQNRQASQGGSPTGSTGTNLNSVAPELIGGSTGPSVGPALSAPINITLNNTESSASSGEIPSEQMYGANHTVPSALMRANPPNAQTSDMAPDLNDLDQTGTNGAPGLGVGSNGMDGNGGNMTDEDMESEPEKNVTNPGGVMVAPKVSHTKKPVRRRRAQRK